MQFFNQGNSPNSPTLGATLVVGKILGGFFRWRRWLVSMQLQQNDWVVTGSMFDWMSIPALLSRPSLNLLGGITLCVYEETILPFIRGKLLRAVSAGAHKHPDLIQIEAEMKQFENTYYTNAPKEKKDVLEPLVAMRKQIFGLFSASYMTSSGVGIVTKFLLDLASKAVTYPIVLTMSQALFANIRHKSHSELLNFASPKRALLSIYEQEGLAGLYKGFGAVVAVKATGMVTTMIATHLCARPLFKYVMSDSAKYGAELAAIKGIKRDDTQTLAMALKHLVGDKAVLLSFAVKALGLIGFSMIESYLGTALTFLSVSARLAPLDAEILIPNRWDMLRTFIGSLVSVDLAFM